MRYLFVALCEESLYEIATRILKIVYNYAFKGEIKLKVFEEIIIYFISFYRNLKTFISALSNISLGIISKDAWKI